MQIYRKWVSVQLGILRVDAGSGLQVCVMTAEPHHTFDMPVAALEGVLCCVYSTALHLTTRADSVRAPSTIVHACRQERPHQAVDLFCAE